MVEAITRQQFDAHGICPRPPEYGVRSTERAWFKHDNENLLGVVVLNHNEARDWSFAILVHDQESGLSPSGFMLITATFFALSSWITGKTFDAALPGNEPLPGSSAISPPTR